MDNCSEALHDYDRKIWSEFWFSIMASQPFWVQIIFVIAKIVIFATSLIGNIITCVVIYCDKSMHTATNFYLFNLAVTDLIVTFSILLEVDEYLSNSYQFGSVACKVHFFFTVVLWNNSILVMTTLAIERYIAIWHPLILKSAPVNRRVIKVIALIWIIAISETLPEVWSVELIKSSNRAVCFTVPTGYARIINGVLALVTFMIPLSIMLFVYTMIAFKVNFSDSKESKNNIFNRRSNRAKINKLIVALTLSFLVCWFPFFIFRVFLFVYDMQRIMKMAKLWRLGYEVMLITNWLSIVLNPILFSLMSTKFRKALKTMWIRKSSRPKSQIVNLEPIQVLKP